MSTSQSTSEPLAYYQSECQQQQRIHGELVRRWRWVGLLRGGSFLAAVVVLILAARAVAGVSLPWLVLSGLLLLVFLFIAFVHERMSRQIRISRLLMNMHRESIARIHRDWDEISMPEYECPSSFEAVAHDLDLFGKGSLFQLLAIVRTPLGVATLGDWITSGAGIDEVSARQMAVRELRDQRQWRQDFRLRCEQLSASRSGPSRFVEWAESPNWTDQHRGLLWFCRATAAVSMISILLLVVGVLPLTIAGPAILVAITLNFFVSVFVAGTLHDIFNSISSHRDEVSHYRDLFKRVIDFPCESPFLKKNQADLHDRGRDVCRHIDGLGRLTWLANIRRNGMLFIPYLAFEFLFMWDIHVLERLERWKDQYGSRGGSWFRALGKWEAILALSKLSHDNPDWQFPLVDSAPQGQAILGCRELGHPLLPDSRVANDVEVGPPSTVLLVTGSNMSGKSTLLRSIGVNAVLAQMGSVVCATRMNMPPVTIETSMRIVDSLAEGTSFFMAELFRLKEIVDRAAEIQASEDVTLLFLLDEILQGTNSGERQIAVSRVVENLIRKGAIGAISTHDLDLASTPELKDSIIPVHFAEQFENINGKRTMTFDYRMRRGIAETTNALKLLELVGLQAPQ